MIVITNDGLVIKLGYERGLLQTLTLKLFVNDYVPVSTSVTADFTEATFSGYVAVAVDDWQAAGLVIDGLARTVEQVREFTWDGTGSPQDIYGYFVVNDDGYTIYAERYAFAPFVLSLAQPTFVVIPRMDMQSIP